MAFLEPAPPLDASAESIYAISPPPQSWPASRVASFLGEYNRQMLRCSPFTRRILAITCSLLTPTASLRWCAACWAPASNAEGWANYCEQMLLDQGYGDGELTLRLMQQKFFLRSVANALLDHNLHCSNMTDEEAVSFMITQASKARGSQAEANPGQARLLPTLDIFRRSRRFHAASPRRAAKARRQVRQGRFHEAVLSAGTVPVKYLPELKNRTIAVSR